MIISILPNMFTHNVNGKQNGDLKALLTKLLNNLRKMVQCGSSQDKIYLGLASIVEDLKLFIRRRLQNGAIKPQHKE